MSEDILDDVIKLILNRTALHDFLSVPAPDILHTNDFVQHNQKRPAENEHDFELIYKREFKNKDVIDTPETKTIFCKELISHVQELIELHKKNSSYKEGRDINILSLANLFIKYLEKVIDLSHTTPSPEDSLAYKHLKPLIELNPAKNRQFITQEEFERLVRYCDLYFETNIIPNDVTPVTTITKGHGKSKVYECFHKFFEERNKSPKYPKNIAVFIKTVFTAMHDDKEKTILTSIMNERKPRRFTNTHTFPTNTH